MAAPSKTIDPYEKLAEILEVDNVEPDDILDQFEVWDSLTVLAICAMLHTDYGVALTAADLRETARAADLVELVAIRSGRLG